MALTYFDPIENRSRVKRRYVWGFWGFCAGAAVATLAVTLTHLV